jgi:proteasome alpha subunit
VSEDKEQGDEKQQPAAKPASMDVASLSTHLRDSVAEKTIECAVLDRNQPGTSKYRALNQDELGRLLPTDLKAALTS